VNARPALMAAIAEGAVKGAKAHDADCDDDTAKQFAAKVIDMVIGAGAGAAWRRGEKSFN